MSQDNSKDEWYREALNYYDFVLNLARKKTSNESLAQDITQEVYLKIFDLDEGRRCNPSSMKCWLYRVTNNVIINGKSKEVKTFTCDPVVMSYSLDKGEVFSYKVSANYDLEKNEEPLGRKELTDIVSRSLCKLNPKHREALDLFYIQGLSGKEISEILDIPAGTVRSRLHWASRELKKVVLSDKSILLDRLLSL